MGTISKMSGKCQKCHKRDKCDHKYMEMCAYIEIPQIARETGMSAAQPVLRENMQINAGGVMTKVYKDEIEKEIYNELCKSLRGF